MMSFCVVPASAGTACAGSLPSASACSSAATW